MEKKDEKPKFNFDENLNKETINKKEIIKNLFSLRWWRECVVNPSSTFYFLWLLTVSMAVLYNCTLLLVRSIFIQVQTTVRALWLFLDYISDIIYFLDIFVSSRKIYILNGLFVRNRKMLLKKYLKDKKFVVDLLSTFPTDLLYFFVGVDKPILRINRFLRIYKVSMFFEKTDSKSNYPFIFRATQLVLYIILSFHWTACLYYSMSTWVGLCSDPWVHVNSSCEQIFLKATGTDSMLFIYTYSFYWSLLTLIAMGDVNHPVKSWQFVLTVIFFLLGILLFATIIGNVSDIISSMNSERATLEEKIDGVKQYIKLRKVGNEMENKVTKWFDYLWIDKEVGNEKDVLSCLSQRLREEIAVQIHLDTLRRVAIFKECEAGLLMQLVLKLKLAVFSPGDFVCRKGDIGKELYIIKKGKLEVLSDDEKKVFATLGEGVVFGEISILNIAGNKNGNKRTANIRSVGYSDLYVLSKEDLWETMKEYPEAKERLVNKGREMLRKDNMLDEEKAKEQQYYDLSVEEKVQMLNKSMDEMFQELANITTAYDIIQKHIKIKLTKLEKKTFLK